NQQNDAGLNRSESLPELPHRLPKYGLNVCRHFFPLPRYTESTLCAIVEDSAKLLKFLAMCRLGSKIGAAGFEPYHTADWSSAGIWRRLLPPSMLFSSLLPGTIFVLDFVWELDVTQITGECEVHNK